MIAWSSVLVVPQEPQEHSQVYLTAKDRLAFCTSKTPTRLLSRLFQNVSLLPPKSVIGSETALMSSDSALLDI